MNLLSYDNFTQKNVMPNRYIVPKIKPELDTPKMETTRSIILAKAFKDFNIVLVFCV